jgi:hypothetical protein
MLVRQDRFSDRILRGYVELAGCAVGGVGLQRFSSGISGSDTDKYIEINL